MLLLLDGLLQMSSVTSRGGGGCNFFAQNKALDLCEWRQ
jgi:hypothetical protein